MSARPRISDQAVAARVQRDWQAAGRVALPPALVAAAVEAARDVVEGRWIARRAAARAASRATTPPEDADLIAAVARWHGLRPEDLTGSETTREISAARYDAGVLLRELRERSYPAIGRALGNRAHPPIIRGIRRRQRALAADREYRDQLFAIEAGLRPIRRSA